MAEFRGGTCAAKNLQLIHKWPSLIDLLEARIKFCVFVFVVVSTHIIIRIVGHQDLFSVRLDFVESHRRMRSRVIRLVELGLGEEFVAIGILGEFYIKLNLILTMLAPTLNFNNLFLSDNAAIFRQLATHRLDSVLIGLLWH